MKINESKTKLMIFNKSRKYDFPPEYSFSNNEILEVVEETRLLGIILTSDLVGRLILYPYVQKLWPKCGCYEG